MGHGWHRLPPGGGRRHACQAEPSGGIASSPEGTNPEGRRQAAAQQVGNRTEAGSKLPGGLALARSSPPDNLVLPELEAT